MKVLVTGATGFIGSHVCEHLSEKGHTVFALTRNTKKFEAFQIKGKQIEGQLGTKSNKDWITQIPEDLDAVIHIAGLAHSHCTKDFYKLNTKNTKRLIDDLAARYPKLKFILISSLSAAGPSSKDHPLDEKSPARPVSHFGHSKFQAEIALNEHAPKIWEKIIIRPPQVIGPRDPEFIDFFKMVKMGIAIIPGIHGESRTHTFISVYDLSRIIYKSLNLEEIESNPELFMPGYPEPVTYCDIIKHVQTILGKEKITTIHIYLWILKIFASLLKILSYIFPNITNKLSSDMISELKHYYWVCDSSKTQNRLKLSYKWDIKSIIERTYEDYKERKLL